MLLLYPRSRKALEGPLKGRNLAGCWNLDRAIDSIISDLAIAIWIDHSCITISSNLFLSKREESNRKMDSN
nr:hypothetical protein Q903MT_gene3252 [Picea sitchensis]